MLALIIMRVMLTIMLLVGVIQVQQEVQLVSSLIMYKDVQLLIMALIIIVVYPVQAEIIIDNKQYHQQTILVFHPKPINH